MAYAREHQLPALVSMTLNRLAILAVQQGKDKSEVQALLSQAWQQAQTSSDQRALAETAWNLTQITGLLWADLTSALRYGERALSLARAGHNQELEARCLFTLGMIQLLRGDLEQVIPPAEASQALYALLGTEASVSGELPLPYFLRGTPLTQSLSNRASEAGCWMLLALAHMYSGQMQASLHGGRRSLALAHESKDAWQQVTSTSWLAYGLLEVGAYEEALGLMHHSLALAQTFPWSLIRYRFLICLGRVYHALQQWDEARKTLEEVKMDADLLPALVAPLLSQLCMHFAESGEWVAASRYALQAIAIRQRSDSALLTPDFFPQYETEALLRAGEERQARAEVQRLGERLGHYQRFRLPLLRSLAVLADWDGHGAQAITYLGEAAELATAIGLPEEQWQIQARLAGVYEAAGETAQARLACAKAATIIEELAQGIKDKTLRARFLGGPQIQPVLQHAQGEASPVRQDHAEQQER
jgi:tetratricopeptide (TPR) repeat protein